MIDNRPQEPGYIKRKLQRDWLLASSDWTQLADSPLDDDIKTEWKNYRQLLRDFDYMNEPGEFPLKPGDTRIEHVTPSPTPLPEGI